MQNDCLGNTLENDLAIWHHGAILIENGGFDLRQRWSNLSLANHNNYAQ